MMMHKAEKKYEVRKVIDEEHAKQRQLRCILNKLHPRNFEKLFEQVKQVNIDNAGTLTGVISQIFDKALMEPTFCEMYANFCYHLAGELPDFNEDNEKITFKRLLLNKCQEEFERGEREQEEANRTEEEGEAKQTAEEREEKRIRAHRRMLGNIRLIGELYNRRMLTEIIMHKCIKKLLGQYQNPDEEDVEALCELMSTIGENIDQPKAKVHMDVYFNMIAKLSNNMKLSSRIRFILKDTIDLRKNKWQQQRKVKGPKKIEEVHRDAAQERARKFSVPRKATVKIIPPDTHKELRLDKRAESYMDGGSSGPRLPHYIPPQTQPIPSYPLAHQINYYTNSYNPGSLFFPPQSSLPLTSTQVTPSPQAPRFYNQASQGCPPPVAFMNPSSLNSVAANKAGVLLHGIAESSVLERGRDGHSVISLPQSTPVQVTLKPAVSYHREKVADSSILRSSPAVEKDSAPKVHRPHGDANPISPRKDAVGSKPSASAAGSVSAENLTANSIKADEQKKPGKKGHSLQQNEVGGQSASDSNFPSQPLDQGTSINGGNCKSVDTTTTPTSSGASRVPHESTGAPVHITDNTGAKITVDASPSRMNERPKNVTVGPKEQVENTTPEESQRDEIHKSSESVNQTKQISDLEVTTSSNEAGNPKVETAQKKLDEPLNPDKSSTSDASRSDGVGNKEIAALGSGTLNQDSPIVSIPPVSEGTESNINGPISPSGSKDKPLLEPNKGKNTMNKRKKKKKKKEILQKADAAGTTFDLYNAYKGPEEKNDISTSAENTEAEAVSSKNVPPVSSQEDVVPNEKSRQSKAELEDWEDAANISTPKLGSSNKQNREVLAKKYSRDFLLKFSEHCIILPKGFQITPDTADAFVVIISRDYPSPGIIIDRPMGGSRLDRRRSMGSSIRRVQPSPIGSNILSSPDSERSGYGNQVARSDERQSFENRVLLVPLPHRPIGG